MLSITLKLIIFIMKCEVTTCNNIINNSEAFYLQKIRQVENNMKQKVMLKRSIGVIKPVL